MTEIAQPPLETIRELIALCNKGRFSRAELQARKLLRKYPKVLILHDVLGAAFAGQHKHEEAVASCREALKVKPDHAVAYSNMGVALRDLGRFEEAAASCREALKIRPDYAEAHNNLANALQSLGKLEEAAASYRKALTINPAYPVAYNNLGAVLRELGNREEAVASYREALKLQPDYAEAYANMSIVLRELGRPEDAIAACQQALGIKPRYATAHNNLGVALRELGKLEAAAASYREALRNQPGYAEAHNNLANVLRDLGRTEEAVSHYRKVLKLRPEHAMARHMLAALTGETTATAPRDYTVKLFDDYAKTFDHHLVEVLKYDAPTRLAGLLRKALPHYGRFGRALDVGCGTGLSGTAFREFADHLTGVDLSREMIRQAREKGIYDEILVADITEFLSRTEEIFDLFICTDVLIYIGELDRLLEDISSRSAPGAVLCLSTEKCEGDGYALRPTGRYAHSETYVRRTAAMHGFSVRALEPIIVRQDKDAAIEGQMFVLEKATAY